MNIRPRTLPLGWYPGSRVQVEQAINNFTGSELDSESKLSCGIVPHAGWGFSGSIACRIISHIDPDIQTIVVIGGHLPPGNSVLAAFEDGYYTPLGDLHADAELLSEIRKEMNITEDIYSDNTVEIQLPFIKYFFPDALILGMRVAPSPVSEQLGQVLFHATRKLGKNAAVLGSTDLTHYGSNYGYSPHGSGKQAVQWVKEVNDKKFIDACITMDTGSALAYANKDHSACSAGGAVCAVSFARETGIKKGILLEYLTSWDIHPSDSFVGYAGIMYSRN
ncbi:MAG: AmmeMemoRadiSam system protein B [Spirochaetales bacterium]|nr:AmmeMemoRadiSam system protein B [Spirochaetales bacterium]